MKAYLSICILWKLVKVPLHLKRSDTKPVILFKVPVDCSRVMDTFIWFYPLILCRTAKSPVYFCKNKHKNSVLDVKKPVIIFCFVVYVKWSNRMGGPIFEVEPRGWSYFRGWTLRRVVILYRLVT